MADPWKRREVIGGQTLLLGDCLEIMPALSGGFEAIVTDPPYGLGDKWKGGGGGKGSSWAFDPTEAQSWDHSAPASVPAMAGLAEDVVIWGGNYFPLPPSRGWLIWDKKQPDTFTTGQCELAWTSIDRPTKAFRFAQCEQANEGPKLHPTQKPLALMLWTLKWVRKATILDPFMGSGTTLVACQRLGRNGIGIEIDKGYFDNACRRVEAEARAPRLDLPEPVQPKQESLL